MSLPTGSAGAPLWPFASPAAPIAIIAALEIEARVVRGPLKASSARLYVSGPGAVRAGSAAESAIANGAGGLLSWGIAGALSGERSSGDVVLPARVVSSSGEWSMDAAWRQRIADLIGTRFALCESVLYSADHVMTSPDAKARLAAATGAVAVDMESAAIAAAAARARLPCVAIRVIADGPDDALPDCVEMLLTADGRTRYRGLWPILLAPRQIPLLFALGRRSAAATRVLGALAEALA